MNNRLKGYLYVMITMSAWGSTYVVSKFILGSVPPFTLLLLRYMVAAVVLYIIMMKKGISKVERQDYKYIIFIGFVGYFIGVGAQFVGTQLSNASMASLINSTNPIFIILFAIPILKEKVTISKIISIAAAVIGAYIIIGGVQGGSMLIGIIACIIATATWSLMSVVSKRATEKYNALTVTTYSIMVAILFTFPISIYEMATIPDLNLLEPVVILSALYLGLICTALAFVLWSKSLSMMEAGICSLFYPVQPMVSVLLGWLFLKEKMNSSFFIGAMLIIAGVMFSILGGKKEQQSEELLLDE
ncbi:MAG: EamA family transporter [Clostridiales bacterium]|nr:EamA family transporter [Clostridiales bacterium]